MVVTAVWSSDGSGNGDGGRTSHLAWSAVDVILEDYRILHQSFGSQCHK